MRKKLPKQKPLGNNTGTGATGSGDQPKPLKRSHAKVGHGNSKMPSYDKVHRSVRKTMGY